MMDMRRIKKKLDAFRNLPLHPQFLITRGRTRRLREIAAEARGVTLDIGCDQRPIEGFLPDGVLYFGLDYPMSGGMPRGGRPDILADAHRLPVASESIDTVTLVNVPEHLERPVVVLGEARRVLRPGGRVILQVPFLYPVHEAPRDFQRWTSYGLRALAKEVGFQVERMEPNTSPTYTGAALLALGLAIGFSEAVEKQKWVWLLSPVIAVLVLVTNGIGWLAGKFENQSGTMTLGYHVWLRRP